MERWFKLTGLALLSLLTLLIPLASTAPDGLERVAESLGVEEGEAVWRAPLPDYEVRLLGEGYLATLAAGVTGFFTILAATWAIGRGLKGRGGGG